MLILRSRLLPWFLLAGLLLIAATPEHPGHLVKLDRLQVTAADNGKFLGITAGKVTPVEGVGVPVFVDGASLNPVAGAPIITRDPVTGVLTLPSAPLPPLSLHLYVNGLRQVTGRDVVPNGTTVTPGPDQTLPDGTVYSPRRAILDATEITGDWRR